MTKPKYIEFMKPSEVTQLLENSKKWRNKSQLCKSMRVPTSSFTRVANENKCRLELVQHFENQFKGMKYEKIKIIDPTTFRKEALRRCIRLDNDIYEKLNVENKISFVTLQRYLYHTEEFYYDWKLAIAISDFLLEYPVKSKAEQKKFNKRFNENKKFISNSKTAKGKRRIPYATAARFLYFDVKDWKWIMHELDYTATRLAIECNIAPSALRSCMNNKNNNVSCEMAEHITQTLIQRYRNRHIKTFKLPDRIKIISPYKIEEECEKRGIRIGELYRMVKNCSDSTIQSYYYKRFGKHGPRVNVMLEITEAILKKPVLAKEDQEIFMMRKEGKKEEAFLLDQSGQPKLADGKVWDFYESQAEWINRDQKKLDKLPRNGRLTTLANLEE